MQSIQHVLYIRSLRIVCTDGVPGLKHTPNRSHVEVAKAEKLIYIQQNSNQQVLVQRDPLQDIDAEEEEEAVQVASNIIVVSTFLWYWGAG